MITRRLRLATDSEDAQAVRAGMTAVGIKP